MSRSVHSPGHKQCSHQRTRFLVILPWLLRCSSQMPDFCLEPYLCFKVPSVPKKWLWPYASSPFGATYCLTWNRRCCPVLPTRPEADRSCQNVPRSLILRSPHTPTCTHPKIHFHTWAEFTVVNGKPVQTEQNVRPVLPHSSPLPRPERPVRGIAGAVRSQRSACNKKPGWEQHVCDFALLLGTVKFQCPSANPRKGPNVLVGSSLHHAVEWSWGLRVRFQVFLVAQYPSGLVSYRKPSSHTCAFCMRARLGGRLRASQCSLQHLKVLKHPNTAYPLMPPWCSGLAVPRT